MRRVTGGVVLAVLAALAVSLGAAQQRPNRLLVFNNTGSVAELSFQPPNGQRQSRGRIDPGSSMPVYNVNNGDLFSATWKNRSDTHRVSLGYDRTYGGNQDTWSLR